MHIRIDCNYEDSYSSLIESRSSPSRGPQRIGSLFTTAKILATDYRFTGKCEQQTVDPMPALELALSPYEGKRNHAQPPDVTPVAAAGSDMNPAI